METKDDIENDDYKNTEQEAETLKLDINKFNEERVCIPDPNIVFRKACSIATKLKIKDGNKFQFLEFLEKLFKEVKTFEVEEALPLEDLSLTL